MDPRAPGEIPGALCSPQRRLRTLRFTPPQRADLTGSPSVPRADSLDAHAGIARPPAQHVVHGQACAGEHMGKKTDGHNDDTDDRTLPSLAPGRSARDESTRQFFVHVRKLAQACEHGASLAGSFDLQETNRGGSPRPGSTARSAVSTASAAGSIPNAAMARPISNMILRGSEV